MEEGQQIPLTAVATLDVQGGLGAVTRLDLDRVATVSGDAAPGFNGQAILGQVQTLLQPYQDNLPPGYQMAYTGRHYSDATNAETVADATRREESQSAQLATDGVYAIIKAHSGRIWTDISRGKGVYKTTIVLPLSNSEAVADEGEMPVNLAIMMEDE